MKKFAPLFLLLLIWSCSPETIKTEREISIVEAHDLENPGIPDKVYFGGHEIPVSKYKKKYGKGNVVVFQGDILLDDWSQYKRKKVFKKGEKPPYKSVGRTEHLWPDGIVYYAIEEGFREEYKVHNAIQHWEAKTKLQFIERTNEPNYIYFQNGSGCSSYIGMIGGRQEINVSIYCSTGNVIHEIGHAVGLWHEQSRVDRDRYITIHYDNIRNGREHNFWTYQQYGWDGDEYSYALDFNSIMLYGSYAFSKNGKPTMTKKDGSTFGRQRKGLSYRDIRGIPIMYQHVQNYENGQFYYINGVTVLRDNDTWYFSTYYGWKIVELRDGYWWYV